MKEFYMNIIDTLLKDYKPGDPSNKPDVLEQIKSIDEERRKMALEHQKQQQQQQQQQNGKIILNQNGQNIELNNQQIVQIMQKQQEQLQQFAKMLQEKDIIINNQQTEINNHKDMNNKLNSIIGLLEKQTSNPNINSTNSVENITLEIS